MSVLRKAIIGLLFYSVAGSYAGAAYPERPIRLIIPIAAGSVTDVVMRAAINEIAPRIGQQFVVENRGGASGILGAQACASAPADGYTICAIYHNTVSFNALLFKSLPYNPDKDFEPIARLFFLIEGIAVSNAIDVDSIEELKKVAQGKTVALNFGTLGPGSYPDLFAKWLNKQWKTDIVAVPYKGGGPIAQALAANEIQIGDMGLGNFLGLAEAKQMKILAVSSRSSLMPKVPTFQEAGLNDYPGKPWWGLAAPRGTPRAIVDLLNKEFVAVFSEPKFVAFLEKNAIATAPTSVDDFVEFISHDRRIAQELIKVALPPETEFKPQ